MSAVADTLARSRAAHVAYRAALVAGESASRATVELVEAQRHRLAADHLDPEHTDPAWAAEAPNYPHAELVAFYAQQLARYGLAVVLTTDEDTTMSAR